MGTRQLIEDLQAQVGQAVAEQDETDEQDDAESEASDGEDIEPEDGNVDAAAAMAFEGWDEGVAIVAAVDTVAYDEEGEAVDVPAGTTADVEGVALEADAAGAVVTLEDGTVLLIDAEGAADWGPAEDGEDDEESEDESEDASEEDESEDDSDDEDEVDEARDPLVSELRAILDEGCKKGKKAKGKGKAKCDGSPACVARKGQAVEEASVVNPGEVAQAALAYVYAMLLSDALSGLSEEGEAADVLKASGTLMRDAQRFLTRGKAPLRELGMPPSQLQRLGAKVSARTAEFAAHLIDAAE